MVEKQEMLLRRKLLKCSILSLTKIVSSNFLPVFVWLLVALSYFILAEFVCLLAVYFNCAEFIHVNDHKISSTQHYLSFPLELD